MQLAVAGRHLRRVTEALGIDNVRVIVPDIGGGFGQKIHLIRKYAVLTALMAVKTGRPVKWIEDRSEHMMAGGHSCEQEFDVEAAVKADGEVLGLKILDTDDVGGSISTLTIHFTNKLNNLFNTYKVQHLRLEGRSVVTNKCPVVPNRGIGKPGMCFVWERMMDRIAQELGLDPIEVRRRNLIGADQFPYTTPNGNIYGSGDYQTLLDKALAKVGYDEFRAPAEAETTPVDRTIRTGTRTPQARPNDPIARHRRRHRRRAGRPERRARHGDLSRVEADAWRRRRRRRHGQARKERLRRLHARIAELRAVARDDGVADRRRRAGRARPNGVAMAGTFDSALSPWGVSSSNSGNNFHLYDVGAVHGAASRLRDKVLTLAAHVLKSDKASLQIEDGVVIARAGSRRDDAEGRPVGPGETITFAELGKIAYANQALLPPGFEPGLQVTYYHSHPHADPLMLPDMQGRVRAQYTFSSAAHAAVVEVDPETGRVRVRALRHRQRQRHADQSVGRRRPDLRIGGARHLGGARRRVRLRRGRAAADADAARLRQVDHAGDAAHRDRALPGARSVHHAGPEGGRRRRRDSVAGRDCRGGGGCAVAVRREGPTSAAVAGARVAADTWYA